MEMKRGWDRVTSALFTTGCLFFGLAAAQAVAQLCDGRCSDPLKPCVCVVAPSDAQFSVTRVGAQAVPGQIGVALGVGDQVASSASGAIVELACPGGSEVKLHGAFHALVLQAADGQDCVFRLDQGNADVLSRKPTALDGMGEAVMGSITTQYGMRVSRDAEGSHIQCLVFEGAARVRYRSGNLRELTENTAALWTANRGVQIRPPNADEVAVVSNVYARTDVARLVARGEQPANPAALVQQLAGAYSEVFAAPRNVDARIQLATLQASLGNSRQVLYEAEKAQEIDPARAEGSVDLALGKHDAYIRLGQPENATVEQEKIRRLDPSRYEQLRNGARFEQLQQRAPQTQPNPAAIRR